jgi:hypothetical protein
MKVANSRSKMLLSVVPTHFPLGGNDRRTFASCSAMKLSNCKFIEAPRRAIGPSEIDIDGAADADVLSQAGGAWVLTATDGRAILHHQTRVVPGSIIRPNPKGNLLDSDLRCRNGAISPTGN